MIVSAGFTAPLDRKTAVHDVEVVHLVRPAIPIECRGRRIGAEADSAVLVRNARERDALADRRAAPGSRRSR